MNKFIFFLVTLLVISCKTVQVNQQIQKTTKTVVEIGSIGAIKEGVILNNFQSNTLPTYKQKIRVLVNVVSFTKKTYKICNQAAAQQNKTIKATYADSLLNKPKYINLQIIDKVQLLNELNAAHNSNVNNYLQNSENNQIVMGISAYVDAIDLNNVSQAEEVYLVNDKPKKYNLQLVKNGRTFAIMDISRSVPFAYSTALFCWEKEHGSIKLANLIDPEENCTGETYKNVNRLHKKVNHFKY